MSRMMEYHAREKVGMPAEWVAWLFEVKDSPYGKFYEITGAVCPLKTKGKNRGKPNYSKADKATTRTVQIGADEHIVWRQAWEKYHEKCSGCNGTGQVAWSWSATDGITYRTCQRCEGRGCPEEVAA